MSGVRMSYRAVMCIPTVSGRAICTAIMEGCISSHLKELLCCSNGHLFSITFVLYHPRGVGTHTSKAS